MGRNPNIVIVDEDEFFLKRMGAAMGGGDRYACSVKAFSDRKKAVQAIKETPPDGLIISEDCYDDEMRSIFEGNTTVLGENAGVGIVSRYSGVTAILKTLGDVGNTALKSRAGGKDRVICVFSFCEPGIRTAYALTRAQSLGRSHRTLYVNLDEFPSFCAGDAISFSDAMYEFRKNYSFKGFDLSERTGKASGFDYMSGARCMEDLSGQRPEDLGKFTEALISECGYEKVILDMGNVIRSRWDMDMYCDDIEEVCRCSVERQMSALEEFLWHSGRGDFLEKMQKVNVADDLEGYNGELTWEMNSVKWMNWMN